ncbi:hypothetical protein GF324_13145 [bacterium]|nr:hypothetical protein [bacterium]
MVRLLSMVSLILLLTAGVVQADDDGPRSLFGDKAWDHGGMGGFSTAATGFAGGTAIMGGWHGHWIVNHTFGIGGTGYGIHATDDYHYRDDDFDLNAGVSGMEVEYYIQPENLLHYTVSLGMGGGNLTARRERDGKEFNDAFYYLHPKVNAELNVTNWFRAGGFAGYRYAGNVNLIGLDSGDISGWTAGIQLKFGDF